MIYDLPDHISTNPPRFIPAGIDALRSEFPIACALSHVGEGGNALAWAAPSDQRSLVNSPGGATIEVLVRSLWEDLLVVDVSLVDVGGVGF